MLAGAVWWANEVSTGHTPTALSRLMGDVITVCKCRSPILRSYSRKELVLLHPNPDRRPAGTRMWLRLRKLSWHHHIRCCELSRLLQLTLCLVPKPLFFRMGLYLFLIQFCIASSVGCFD